MTAREGADCRNCGEVLRDRYCHRCGQDSRELPARLAPLAARLFASAFDFDSRPLSSLRALVTRPGRLTAAFVAGQRVRFASPVQIYLWCTAVFFLVHAYAPFVRLDPPSGTIVSALSGVYIQTELPPDLRERLAVDGVPLAAFAARFDAAVSAYLPVLLVGILAAAALLLEVLFRRAPALTHIVFAVHWVSFYFLLEACRQVLPIPAGWYRPSTQVLAAVGFVYLVVAMRVVYGARWPAAALKAVAVIAAFAMLFGLWFASTTALAVRLA